MKSKTLTLMLCVSVFIFPVSKTLSQEVDPISEEVNEQVWQPFKTSYEARDSEAFIALHTAEALRVNDGGIMTAESYFARINSWQKPNNGSNIMIDFAFESRQYTENFGYETGYYRVLVTSGESQRDIYYGMFHVVLRKENGSWKIAQDFDTSTVAGQKIGRDHFENASFLKLN